MLQGARLLVRAGGEAHCELQRLAGGSAIDCALVLARQGSADVGAAAGLRHACVETWLALRVGFVGIVAKENSCGW